MIACMSIDFSLIGQAKSGTTALASFLAQHPDICISVPKETSHFATDLAAESDRFHGAERWFEYRSDEAYERCFAHCSAGALRGDASTAYLPSMDAARNIHAHNPNARIIALLREPVSFMRSLHAQYCNETTEDELSFERALELEHERREGRSIPSRVRAPSMLQYRERARYAPQLARWFDAFGRDQVLVLLAEELRSDGPGQYRRVLEFLGVDPEFQAELGTVHGAAQPRSRRLNRMLNTPVLKRAAFRMLGSERYTALSRRAAAMVMRPASRSAIAPELVAKLRSELAADVDATSSLIGRDLRAAWGWT